MPVRLIVTKGTTADSTQAIPLIEGIEAEHLLAEGCTLYPAIKKVMCGEEWLQSFVDRRQLARASTTAEFLDNLDAIFDDEDIGNSLDGYWARSFLITLLARNCAVHSYPTEDRYYVESFGHMLHAPIAAMLFTWQLAKDRNWIQ